MSYLLDFCKMTSSTGGTSTLTLTAQTGFPDIAEAITGTRYVSYAIAEYTNGAKTQLAKAETGIGSYVASTGVLTRTVVKTTWDGTDYLPKFGTATAPSAINFGSTSANIDITVSAISADTIPSMPFYATSSTANVSSGLGVVSMNLGGAQTTITLNDSQLYYFPALLAHTGMLSVASVRVTTGATAAGGTPSTLLVGIYEVGSGGMPGKLLIDFGSLGRPTSSNTTLSNSALSTPVFLVPGWYWVAVLWVAGTDTGNPVLRAATLTMGATPSGGLLTASVPFQQITASSQTSLSDPGAAPNGNASAINAAFVWFK